jgi:hypothetical protein
MRTSLLVMACIAALSTPAFAATKAAPTAKKEPPSCSALTFRAVAPGTPDGEQQTGTYSSRFMKMAIKANVAGGVPTGYWVELNGQRPEALAGGLPTGAEACLREKKMATPVKTMAGACVGQRFRVVMDRGLKEPAAMLFALDGKDWKFCSATKA